MAKRYCIFSAQYLPHMGGVERYTYYLAKHLIKKGNEVCVVTSLSEGLSEHEYVDGIEILRLPSINLMNGRLPVLKVNAKTKKALSKVLDKKVDFALINTRFYLLSLYGAMFAKKNNIPAGVVEHGTSHLTFNNSILDIFERIYEHGITAILKHYCKNYFGVSKACCKWSAHFGIKSKGVLYNSVDIDEMRELLDKPVISYKKEYNVEDDEVVISYTGRMIPEKGIFNLIDAVKDINSDRKIVVFMAGDGPELKNVKQSIASIKNKNVKIIALGRIDFNHIMALMKETDIYCLPSVSEGFPTSVLEAVAGKCYVITTYNGGARELIKNGESGTILKDNEVTALRKAIEKCVEDEEYIREASEKSYEDLINGFTWEKTADKLIAFTENLK